MGFDTLQSFRAVVAPLAGSEGRNIPISAMLAVLEVAPLAGSEGRNAKLNRV